MQTLNDINFLTETNGKYDLDSIYKSLDDFIFKDIPLNSEFIKNLAELISKELDLKNIGIAIDEDLLNDNEKPMKSSAYAYYEIKTVFLNKKSFTNKFDIFHDILILAHELKHFDIENKNKNHKKFIGRNSHPYYFSSNSKLFTENLNINDNKILFTNYLINQNENLADEFAFEFSLKFIENFITNLTPIESEFVKFLEKSLQATITERKIMHENALDKINKIEFLLSEQREILIEKIIDLMPKSNNERAGAERIQSMTAYFNTFLMTFENYYDIKEFNLYKNAFHKNSANQFLYIYFYIQMLNFPNYVVTTEDLFKLNALYLEKNIPFDFSELTLDRQNLIEFYLLNILKVDSNTVKQFIKKKDLSTISSSEDLIDKLEFFNKKQEITNTI